MKLMTYNILDGGIEQTDLLIKIIRKQDPDILVLNEANTFEKNDNERLKYFSNRLNMPYYHLALCGDGDDYHVALFSKYKWQDIVEIKNLMRACIIAEFNTNIGKLKVAGLHLTPYKEELRLPEIRSIVNHFKDNDLNIVMGDMNSLSKNDNYKANFIDEFNDKQKEKFTKDGQIKYEVIEIIKNSGFIDSAVYLNKNKDNTVPTLSNKDAAHATLRLDYIFVTKHLQDRLSGYEVIKNNDADLASDHYPVIVNLTDIRIV